MHLYIRFTFVACGLLACGCSATLLPIDAPRPIDGLYRSTGEVGALGQLQLIVRKREKSVRVFEAELDSDGPAGLGLSEGVGTLGNDHLILNFDIGETDDYYFQGFVEQDTEGDVTGLNGTFIFADQPEQLPVEFERIGDAPPLPQEEVPEA